MKIPIKVIRLPDWAKVCNILEKQGSLILHCKPEETRALYIWAKKNRGYRISYVETGAGLRISKQK